MAVFEKRCATDGKTHYRVKIRIKGAPSLSRTFVRLTDARKWAYQAEMDLKRGHYITQEESRKRTIKEAIDRYRRDILAYKAPSNIATEESRLRWWEQQLGSCTLAQVTPALITECRDRLLSQGSGYTNGRLPTGDSPGLSPSTVNKYLRMLNHLFTVAIIEWEWLDESPMKRIARPQDNPGRVRFLDQDELQRLLSVSRESDNPYLHTALVVSISTGMRAGELFGLTWDRVDLEQGRCRLDSIQTKTRTSRAVFIRGEALRLMRQLHQDRQHCTRLCFPSPKKPSQPYDIRRPFKIALKKAGIENFTWHDLRHCCASYLIMNGATLAEVAEVLGHRTLAMVKRYAHLSESHTANVVERMNDRIFG